MIAKMTKAGRMKLLRARAGEITLPKIVGFAFGDGGVNSNGTVADVGETIRSEFMRKEIDNYTLMDGRCQYFCTLSGNEANGKSISEIGLYDADGDIIMLANFTAKGKDEGISMRFEIDDIL